MDPTGLLAVPRRVELLDELKLMDCVSRERRKGQGVAYLFYIFQRLRLDGSVTGQRIEPHDDAFCPDPCKGMITEI